MPSKASKADGNKKIFPVKVLEKESIQGQSEPGHDFAKEKVSQVCDDSQLQWLCYSEVHGVS